MLDSGLLKRFALDMAAAFSRLADGIEVAPAASRAIQAQATVSQAKVASLLPGHRQRAVFTFLQGVDEDGATTGQINDGIGYDFSNTYTTMQRLQQLGIVKLIGEGPQRWRLAEEYRDRNA
jgi:hypothetical protein